MCWWIRTGSVELARCLHRRGSLDRHHRLGSIRDAHPTTAVRNPRNGFKTSHIDELHLINRWRVVSSHCDQDRFRLTVVSFTTPHDQVHGMQGKPCSPVPTLNPILVSLRAKRPTSLELNITDVQNQLALLRHLAALPQSCLAVVAPRSVRCTNQNTRMA